MRRTLGGYGRILGAFCAQFQDCLPILLFAYGQVMPLEIDRKSTRLNSSHLVISYAVFCLKKNPGDLFRALATRAASRRRAAGLTRRVVSAETVSRQTVVFF